MQVSCCCKLYVACAACCVLPVCQLRVACCMRRVKVRLSPHCAARRPVRPSSARASPRPHRARLRCMALRRSRRPHGLPQAARSPVCRDAGRQSVRCSAATHAPPCCSVLYVATCCMLNVLYVATCCMVERVVWCNVLALWRNAPTRRSRTEERACVLGVGAYGGSRLEHACRYPQYGEAGGLCASLAGSCFLPDRAVPRVSAAVDVSSIAR